MDGKGLNMSTSAYLAALEHTVLVLASLVYGSNAFGCPPELEKALKQLSDARKDRDEKAKA